MATYKNLRKVLNLPTLSESPSSGVNGEMYFNTTDSALYIYDGEWKKATQSAIATPHDWTATTQQAKIQASDAAERDQLGYSIAISGDTMVATAPYQDTGGSNTGAVYVFTRSGTTWSQQAKLQASDAAANDQLGKSIAISGDTMVVGEPFQDTTGAAYVFTRSGTSWSQQAKIQASDAQANDEFGYSVAIDGDTVVVGAYYEDTGGDAAGAAYVFTRSGTTWSQQAKIQSSDKAVADQFGRSVSISSDTIVAGAWYQDTGGSAAGAAYVFTRSGTSWSQQAKVVASDAAAGDQFGSSVSISGDTVVVGAWLEDTTGAAYVFTRSGTSWSQQAKLVASDAQSSDRFGISVDIDGDSVIVGAYLEDTGASAAGAAYVFTRSGTTWTEAKKIQASDAQADDQFGLKTAIDGNTAVAGAKLEDTGSDRAGAVYTFVAG